MIRFHIFPRDLCGISSPRTSKTVLGTLRFARVPRTVFEVLADSLFLVAEPRYLKDLCILDFHSKSPDLVTIILDLSKVTVPEE